MITRARARLNSLAALAALAFLLIGLPFVLYRFGGSPLPGRTAAWPDIAKVLSSSDDGTLLFAIVRTCSWLAWLLFTACVVAEAQAAFRGSRAPRRRLGGMQGAAAYLVALAALAFTAAPTVTLAASITAASQSAQPDARTARAAPATRLVTVRPGDCLWSLAQRYLGAGDRYREIARLNRGREMDGGQVFRNPSLIEPGWQLLIPDSSASPSQVPAVSHHLGHPTADEHYRRRHPAAAKHKPQQATVRHLRRNGLAATSPAASESAGPANGLTDEGPGQTHVTTGVAGYHASVSGDTPGSLLPEAAFFIAGALSSAVLTRLSWLRRKQRQHRRLGRRIPLPADPEVLRTELRLRATASTEQVETLREALSCLEVSVRQAGQELPDIVGLHVTRDALEVLLTAPAADAPPPPFVISPGRQGMCWQLDLPAMVTTSALQGTPTSRAIGGLGCHLLPGLITAGATSSGYLLLDLESMQVAGCDGPLHLIDQFITTVATELATAQWSGWYDLILVGCDELAGLGRAEHCPTLGEAIDLLVVQHAAAARRISDHAPADIRELRLAEPDNEDWGLTVLVSRVEPSAEQMTELLQLADDGLGGIAALVAGDPESDDGRMAPTVMQLAPDPERSDGIVANIVPLQITVRPRALSVAEYDAIGLLLATATDLDDVSNGTQPYAACGDPPWIPQAADLRSADEDTDGPEIVVASAAGNSAAERERLPEQRTSWDHGWDGAGASLSEQSLVKQAGRTTEQNWVPGDCWLTADGIAAQHTEASHMAAASRLEIRILGPFAIIGGAEQLQPKQAELILALALAAPAGLTNSALSTMLGADPDHPKPADAVRQTITRTRRRLGLADDGQEYIIHVGNGQYVLHPDAELDWSRFRQLIASGRADDLRAAVSLINGQPFTGSYFWWIDIPLAETVRAELVDAAEMLAEFELAAGSPRASAKAARAGLLAEPSAEQLWRAVMRAEKAAGNLAGVAEAWRRCLDAIVEIAPDGEPHPDTAILYRQLVEGRSAPVEAR